jgi:Uncharacterized conserved protein
MVQLMIDDSVREKWLGEAALISFVMDGWAYTDELSQQVAQEVMSTETDIRTAGKDILHDQMIERMRTTFRAMPDMDPTRYRPASEALIRRCLDKGLFRITPLVDVNNVLSIRLRIPLGIYALNRLASTDWTYRIGYPGETYFTVSQQPKNAEGKLVVSDPEGIIGSPVSDSARAAIQTDSDRILVIAYLPLDSTKSEAEHWTQEITETFKRLFLPQSTSTQIVVR